MGTSNRHAVARCRWCGGSFIRFFYQWRCETDACFERQVSESILAPKPVAGMSPYLFLALPLQVDIAVIPTKRLLVHGAAGISKSYGGRWYAYQQCLKIPGLQVLLLRCTSKQLEDNHLQFVDAELALLGDGRYVKSPHKFIVFGNSSQIRFGFCNDASDIAGNIGQEWDLIIPEEAVHFLTKALKEITARDRGSAPSRIARFALDMEEGRSRLLTNPGGQSMDYLKTFYIDKNPDPKQYPSYDPQWYGHITGDIEDNPYLSEHYRSSTLGGHDALRLAQLADGRWDVYPGQFFPGFNASKHVQEIEP